MTPTPPERSTAEILGDLERAIIEEAEALREGNWARLSSIAEHKAELVAAIGTPINPQHRVKIEWLIFWGRHNADLMQEVLATITHASASATYDARARRSDARLGARGVAG